MSKLTKAQHRLLVEHLNDGPASWLRRNLEDGWRPRYLPDRGSPNYDFVGRCRDLGLIEIVGGTSSGWPFWWDGTRITDAGRAALTKASSP